MKTRDEKDEIRMEMESIPDINHEISGFVSLQIMEITKRIWEGITHWFERNAG